MDKSLLEDSAACFLKLLSYLQLVAGAASTEGCDPYLAAIDASAAFRLLLLELLLPCPVRRCQCSIMGPQVVENEFGPVQLSPDGQLGEGGDAYSGPDHCQRYRFLVRSDHER